MPDASPAAAQRRTVATLVVSQVLGGIGTSGGIAVGSLLAESILGSSGLAGLANTFQILGSALLVIPMVRLMARRGRNFALDRTRKVFVSIISGLTRPGLRAQSTFN